MHPAQCSHWGRICDSSSCLSLISPDSLWAQKDSKHPSLHA